MHKTIYGGFLENPRLWGFSSKSEQAENVIKVEENGREGVFVEVDAKALRSSFPKAFQRGEENIRSNKRAQNWFP